MADLAKGVTTLAMLVTITRDDTTQITFTSHDTPIVYNGTVFRNDLPFNVTALTQNSDLSVDSSELEMAIDGVVVTKEDVAQDLYRGGQIEIAFINWQNLANGKLVVRQGWFTSVVASRPQTLKFEIGGLMKVLDMNIGRLYQPACDATFGDRRCRVAIDPSQAHSPLNPYGVGDWAFVFDRTLMMEMTGSNLSFESETALTQTSPITGWTRFDGPNSFGITGLAPAPLDGANVLEVVGPALAQYNESGIFQDFDLVAEGMAGADIDAGKYALIFYASCRQRGDTQDMGRMSLDLLDADKNILESADTRFFQLDAPDVWREKALYREALPGTRYARLTLWMQQRRTPAIGHFDWDDVQPFFFDVTAASPYGDVIHKCTRIVATSNIIYNLSMANPSFEQNGSGIVNGNVDGAIAGWNQTAADYWKVAANINGIGLTGAPDGGLLLVGGNSGSGVQATYNISTKLTFSAADFVDPERLKTGFYGGRLFFYAVAGNLTDQGAVQIEFFDATDASLGAVTALALGVASAVGAAHYETTFLFPDGTSYAVVSAQTVTTTGTSVSEFGFDGFRLQMFDLNQANENDLTSDVGVLEDSDFDHTGGNYTQDGNLIWQAFATQRGIDTVASVPSPDRKTFTGTTIAGPIGAFVTSPIRWLTGDNKGRVNIVRGWNPSTQGLKCYFPNIKPIQVGDKFQYARACGKTFVADCVATFNNGINFQGFPYVPGSISALQENGGLGASSSGGNASLPGVKTLTPRGDVSGSIGGSGTVNLALPAGTVAGDVAIAWVAHTGDASQIAMVAAGWTDGGLSAIDAGGIFAGCIRQSYKIITAADITAGHLTLIGPNPCGVSLSVIGCDVPATTLGTTSFAGVAQTLSPPPGLTLAPAAFPCIGWAFIAVTDTIGSPFPLTFAGSFASVQGLRHPLNFSTIQAAYFLVSDNRAANPAQSLPTLSVAASNHDTHAYMTMTGYLLVT